MPSTRRGTGVGMRGWVHRKEGGKAGNRMIAHVAMLAGWLAGNIASTSMRSWLRLVRRMPDVAMSACVWCGRGSAATWMARWVVEGRGRNPEAFVRWEAVREFVICRRKAGRRRTDAQCSWTRGGGGGGGSRASSCLLLLSTRLFCLVSWTVEAGRATRAGIYIYPLAYIRAAVALTMAVGDGDVMRGGCGVFVGRITEPQWMVLRVDGVLTVSMWWRTNLLRKKHGSNQRNVGGSTIKRDALQERKKEKNRKSIAKWTNHHDRLRLPDSGDCRYLQRPHEPSCRIAATAVTVSGRSSR
jgi:hypothetical protein